MEGNFNTRMRMNIIRWGVCRLTPKQATTGNFHITLCTNELHPPRSPLVISYRLKDICFTYERQAFGG